MPIEILHGYEINLKKAKEFKMPRPASTNRNRFDSYCAQSLFNLNKCYSLPMNISNMAELFTLRMILLTRTQTVFFIFLPFFLLLFFLLWRVLNSHWRFRCIQIYSIVSFEPSFIVPREDRFDFKRETIMH